MPSVTCELRCGRPVSPARFILFLPPPGVRRSSSPASSLAHSLQRGLFTLAPSAGRAGQASFLEHHLGVAIRAFSSRHLGERSSAAGGLGHRQGYLGYLRGLASAPLRRHGRQVVFSSSPSSSQGRLTSVTLVPENAKPPHPPRKSRPTPPSARLPDRPRGHS